MKRFSIFLVLLYIVVGAYLYFGQRSFIYFPVAAPDHLNLVQSTFAHAGHEIKASVVNKGKPSAIIYFGGNAERVDFNADSFAKWFPDHTIYLIKYRGYGGSTGEPSEAGIYADALHIFDALNTKHADISVIGRSLGSGVASYLASERPVYKLALVTAFDSVEAVAQSQFPIYPMGLLLTDKHDSYSRAKEIGAKTLVIAAENDKVIGMAHTQRLVSGFEKEVGFEVIKGVGHNDISGNPRYGQLLSSFMRPRNID